MNEKKISIITVCYNAQETIQYTIDSVLSQQYSNFEYIIIDGQSTDMTCSILSSINNPKFKYISEPDEGIYDAMNKALGIASGDFLIFLGADDLFYSDKVLLDVVPFLIKQDVVYYGDVLLKRGKKLYDGKFSRWKFGYKNVCHQSIFYPKSVYKAHLYDRDYKFVADWVYNLNLLKEGIDFIYINQIISIYNNEDGASSSNFDNNFLKNKKSLIISSVGHLPYYYGLFVKTLNKCVDYLKYNCW